MLKPFFKKGQIEAGCDEAGRGCLAGPVVAAAVILPAGFSHPFLNDSKQLSEKRRDELRGVIEQEAVSWAVSHVSHTEIDRINILNASIEAMHRAVNRLKVQPALLLIDGNRFKPHAAIPHRCFVKGDARWMSIAAASILAKTHRDEVMQELHQKHPEYGWDRNKGYPTIAHRNAVIQFGTTPFHRSSFNITSPQLKLRFKDKAQ